MKSPAFTLLLALIALGFGAGCSHVDLTAEAKRTRVLNGTLNTGLPLPAGAEVLVRLVAVNRDTPAAATGADSPAARPGTASAEMIIGELVQTLAAPSSAALPFQLEFDADDALLRQRPRAFPDDQRPRGIRQFRPLSADRVVAGGRALARHFAHDSVAVNPPAGPPERRFFNRRSTIGDPELGGWNPPLPGSAHCAARGRWTAVRLTAAKARDR
jgi:hypothetical protein